MKNTAQNQHHDYIGQHREVPGARAWREYQTHGRGALLVGGLDEAEDFTYLPLAVLAIPLLEDFARFAEEYDPSREIVVIFLQQPSAVSAYKGGIPAQGTPPLL